MAHLVSVAAFSDVHVAHIVKGMLENEGLFCCLPPLRRWLEAKALK